MDTTPTTEAVYQAVYTLYNNPNSKEKEKASAWLEEFQKSIYSWSISDQLLQQKGELQSCYFAAQTMRNKIQNSFHELPVSAHESLKDSLYAHIGQIDEATNPIIVTQLCLAVSDLVLLMPCWKNPVLSTIEKFSSRKETVWPLLEILALIPEEVNSRFLRLGANRRDEIHKQLIESSAVVFEFLVACLTQFEGNINMVYKVIRCYNTWLSSSALPLTELKENLIVRQAFNLLTNLETEGKLHDTSSDCICTILQCFEDPHTSHPDLMECEYFNAIVSLEHCFQAAVLREDLDKAINFSRIFSVLAESYLKKMASSINPPHYSIKSLDLVLACVNHYDYEIAEITFNMWYKLSEEIYNLNDDKLNNQFKPYVEKLIGILYRHCQMDPDYEGLIDDSDSFSEFRRKVSDLIKDVIFIVGSSNCFKQMFIILQEPSVTWEKSESALFVMVNVAKNILPDENEIVPKVVEAILSLPENTHIAFRFTSIMLLGELCEWIDSHPESLQAVLNFLLYALQQRNGLAAAAATALTSICTNCRDHMALHSNGLIEIARSIESFEISNEAVIGLLKGIAVIISRLPKVQLHGALQTLLSFQVAPLVQIVESDSVKVIKGDRSDPTVWIDRICAIIRHFNPDVGPSDIHPLVPTFSDSWSLISSVLLKYQADGRVMERTCRLIRYSIRSIGKQAAHLLEPIVKQIVTLYGVHQHSCFLYLGSILVDEFKYSEEFSNGLLEMLQAFIEPTFNMLQVENGLKNNPDMVDDFFRLCSRFIECCALSFLQSPAVTPIIQCALLACTLEHRDANVSVMKFFVNLIKCGRSDSKYEVTRIPAQQIIRQNGESLVMNLIHASVFYLHSYMLTDVAEVFVELRNVDRENLPRYLKSAVDTLPKKNSGGFVTATQPQLDEFCETLLRADSIKSMNSVLKDLTRLYR